MLYGAEVVCSEINAKQINRVWAECQFLSSELCRWTQNVGYEGLSKLCEGNSNFCMLKYVVRSVHCNSRALSG